LVHVTYPKQEIEDQHCKDLPSHVKRIIAVMHDRSHYGVMEITIASKTITIFDGLSHPILNWTDHILNALKRCKLVTLGVTHTVTPEDLDLGQTRQTVRSNAYSMNLDTDTWRLQRGHFISQLDGFNCGPIACMKILELYSLVDALEAQQVYQANKVRKVVINYWKRFLQACSGDLPVRVRQRNRELNRGDGVNPSVEAALSASSNAMDASMDLCFCCSDALSMELIRLPCCQKTVHRLCLLGCLSMNSQCLHCRKVLDMSKVPEYPIIKRDNNLPETPDSSRVIRSLQHDLNYAQGRTPLRESDRIREESREKKRLGQLVQANKMIRLQGDQLRKEGCGPGAVVTVRPDYREVSHGIGIVGIVFKCMPSGGVRVATQYGIISHANAVRWYPADQYVMGHQPEEHANIPPDLQSVRGAILNGTYDENTAKKLTIQKIHQLATQSISPCKRGKCSCANGKCKPGCCGCIKNNYKCTSACSCNGNCTANINNGK
jgi:hypothetical protein